MKKLRNGFLDILFFYIYHTIVILFTGILFLALSHNISVFDFRGILKSAKAQIVNMLNPLPLQINSKVFAKSYLAHVKQVRGTAMGHENQQNMRLLKVNDTLGLNSTVETKEKSSILLTFGNIYTCQVRLGNSTTFAVMEMMKLSKEIDEKEKTLFSFVKGVMQTSLENKNKKADLRVKNKLISFGVRGTKFAIVSDGETFTLLAVKEGKVETDNFVKMTKNTITNETCYIVFANGEEKIFSDPALLAKFDWGFKEGELSVSDFLPTVEQHKAVLTVSVPQSETPERNLKAEIENEIKLYIEGSSLVEQKITDLERQIYSLQDQLSKEKPQIEEDQNCLIKSKKPCELFSEKILLLRGFPRTSGTSRYLKMMFDDLEKYLGELEADLKGSRKLLEEQNRILSKRAVILKEAQVRLEQGKELESIIPFLQSNTEDK